jgi:outer membrane protein
VAGALAQWRAAEQRVVQAQAGFGPVAGLALNKSETRYYEAPDYDLRRYSAKQATLQITQPLLRSALLPALDAAQAQLTQAQAALDQARADTTVRLLEAGFDLLKARDTLTLIDAQRIAAEEQMASARRSFKVGRSTIVDVREAEAKIDTVAAQAIAAQADLDLRQQLLAEQVGRPAPELLDRGLSGDLMPQLDAAAVLSWIAEAQLHSPQLQQAQQALLTAEAEVRKAWQGHAPTADLNYTYTQSSDTGTVTSLFPRRGDSSQVGVSVNIPLFASGATQSKVKEAMALRDKAHSDVDAARRSVQIGVRQSFSNTLGAVGLVRGLETATRSLEVALQANRRGYEVGMKVNADVLESQTKIFESRRDLSRARYDAWLNFVKLKTFAGRLSDADIDQLDALLLALPPNAPRGRTTPREVRP